MSLHKPSYPKGVALFLAGSWFLSLVTLLVDQICSCVFVMHIMFIQFFAAFIILLPFNLRKGAWVLKTSNLKLHLLRAIVAVIGGYMYYTAMRFLPVINVMLVENTTPVFIPLISMFWLKEKIPTRLWPAVLIGFIGVYWVLNPKHFGLSGYLLFPIIAANATAFVSVAMRKLNQTEPVEQIIFYFFGLGALFTLPFMVLTPVENFPWEYLPQLITIGALYGFSSLFTCEAYLFSMPGRLAPFVYFENLFTILISWFILHVAPSPYAFIGMGFILTSAFIMLYHPVYANREKID